MLYFKIIVSTLALIFIIRAFVKYNPKFDIVISRNSRILFLWYNKYDWAGDCTRTYIKLFKV